MIGGQVLDLESEHLKPRRAGQTAIIAANPASPDPVCPRGGGRRLRRAAIKRDGLASRRADLLAGGLAGTSRCRHRIVAWI